MKKADAYADKVCRYFDQPGPGNTRAAVEAVCQRASQLGINRIIIPSYTGQSALLAAKLIDPAKIVVVRTAYGFEKADAQAMKASVLHKLASMGMAMVTGTHALGGVGRSVRKKLGTYQVDEIIAYTLRVFGQGTKVAVEAALMAADAGFVRTDEDVISTGGSSSGIDTALVLRPVNASSFLDMKIREVICKPVDF
ncbi:MAG: pyruvate kinase alpha/beta domain-containing protein [Smithellaceae bacterium]